MRDVVISVSGGTKELREGIIRELEGSALCEFPFKEMKISTEFADPPESGKYPSLLDYALAIKPELQDLTLSIIEVDDLTQDVIETAVKVVTSLAEEGEDLRELLDAFKQEIENAKQ